MMIRSIILFTHLVGMVLLFGTLAVEYVGLESLRRVVARAEGTPWMRIFARLPRAYGIALGLTLLSGIALAARVGVHGFAWVRLSLLGMVLMAIVGATGRSRMRVLASDDDVESLRRHASDTLLRVSIRTRIALGLAIVFLMIAKADLITCLVAMAVALLVGPATALLSPARKLSGA